MVRQRIELQMDLRYLMEPDVEGGEAHVCAFGSNWLHIHNLHERCPDRES